MRIPPDAMIPQDKLTKYLLVERARSDKSKWLGRIGFSISSPAILEAAIRRHADEGEAILEEQDVYGDHFGLVGDLVGPRGVLRVKSVWVRRAGEESIRFVTLRPAKETP